MLFEAYWDDDIIFIPVEIQIKTHLQTAWGDITHDESYKPEDEGLKNQWEFAYSKHIADVLDVLDEMASTIRKQRLSVVKPPVSIDDNDRVINNKSLSYKVAQFYPNFGLTQQEATEILKRLKEEGFITIADIGELLQDSEIEIKIKLYKEALRNPENVSAFEKLYYGSILKRGDEERFKQSMREDYGFVEHLCQHCNRLLTNDEISFLREKTDVDLNYFCNDHVSIHLPNHCQNCGTLTAKSKCKNCEASDTPF
jgi:hypothetical protein